MSAHETADSLYYKAQTVKCLNECLQDRKKAVSDETIAAVLCLLFVVVSRGPKLVALFTVAQILPHP
jgi:hypothetical protein